MWTWIHTCAHTGELEVGRHANEGLIARICESTSERIYLGLCVCARADGTSGIVRIFEKNETSASNGSSNELVRFIFSFEFDQRYIKEWKFLLRKIYKGIKKCKIFKNGIVLKVNINSSKKFGVIGFDLNKFYVDTIPPRIVIN